MTVSQPHPNPNHRSGIDCPQYQPLSGSKRCQHYLDGGACALAAEFMCVEWLKRNGRPVPQEHPAHGATPAQPGFLPGLAPPAPAHATPAPEAAAPQAPSVPAAEPPPVSAHTRAPITPEELDSFKSLGVELRLDLDEVGPVWLVPRYTGQARKEITPEHAATLRLLLDAFPGARIAAFEKATSAKAAEAQA
jgi:hypothetical protein